MNEVPFSVSAPTDRPDFDVEGGIARRPDTGDGLGLDLLEPEKSVKEEAPKEEPVKPNAGRVEGTHGNPAADFDPDAQDKAVQLGLIPPAEAQMAKEVAALSTATWGAEARRRAAPAPPRRGLHSNAGGWQSRSTRGGSAGGSGAAADQLRLAARWVWWLGSSVWCAVGVGVAHRGRCASSV